MRRTSRGALATGAREITAADVARPTSTRARGTTHGAGGGANHRECAVTLHTGSSEVNDKSVQRFHLSRLFNDEELMFVREQPLSS